MHGFANWLPSSNTSSTKHISMGLDNFFLQYFVAISQLNKWIWLLISDIWTLIFALQLINSKSSRSYFNFHKIHVNWREIISWIFFKIYNISTKYPAIIHTAETIEILSQFIPKEKIEGYMPGNSVLKCWVSDTVIIYQPLLWCLLS